MSDEVIPTPDPPKPARARSKRPAAGKVTRPTGTESASPARKCTLGHPVSDEARFCPQDGTEIRDMDWKPRCGNGHEVGPADKYCAQCGLVVSATAPPVVNPDGSVERPRPDGELSEAEREERARRHAEAVRLGRESPAVAFARGQAPRGTQTTVAHFLVDGITAFGVTWMRGQEIEIWPGHPRWAEAQPWITLDAAGQYARFGRQIFGLGPWPGAQSYTAGAGMFQPMKAIDSEAAIPQPTEEDLARADEAERRRGRRVPMPII
jgi:hypothetical protein